jgi:chromosome transmission fidelity protein 4
MKEQCRLTTSPGSAPTDALWTNYGFWLVTADGRILEWKQDVLPTSAVSDSTTTVASKTQKGVTKDQHTTEPNATDSSKEAPVRKRLQKAVDAQNNDDDDDDDVDFSQPANRFIADEAMEDNDEDDDNGSTAKDHVQNFDEAEKNAAGENDSEDDDDDEQSFDMNQFPPATSRPHPTMSLPVVEMQAAFGPSSTPLEDPRRFLCWNQHGAMSVRETDPGRSTIDIDFTDSAFRRPISFTDTVGFILGSLGEDGAILASDVPDTEEDEDNDLGDVVDGLRISETTKAALKNSRKKSTATNGSTIYFRRYETFASNREKDWYLTLPAGERVLGCATGEGWAAVVTHRRFVRLFSSGGNQGQVFWIEGDPVSMVGRSRFLAVVYHQSSPLLDGTQQMGYSVFDAVAGRVVAKGALSCLSSRASLQWIGFSNDSALMAMDSDGMLSMLVASAESTQYWEWMPVLDTLALRKSSEDTHWPIHVSDGKCICVPLKGGKKYPDVARRPVTTTIGLRLPLARGPLPNLHAVEELSVRALVTLHQRKAVQQALHPGSGGGSGEEAAGEDEDFAKEYHALSAQVDKVTLKFFASLIEADKQERALDLVERLHLERSFDLAMKIAGRHSKLVDRIEEARDRKFPVDDEEEEEEEVVVDEHESVPPEATSSHQYHTMPSSRVSPESAVNRNKKRTPTNDWLESSAKARRVS